MRVKPTVLGETTVTVAPCPLVCDDAGVRWYKVHVFTTLVVEGLGAVSFMFRPFYFPRNRLGRFSQCYLYRACLSSYRLQLVQHCTCCTGRLGLQLYGGYGGKKIIQRHRLLCLIIITLISCEQSKSWSSSLCNFLNLPFLPMPPLSLCSSQAWLVKLC